MKKLLSLLVIFLIVLSCSSDETSTPVTPPPAPIAKYTISFSAGDGGTVSTTGGEYEEGQTVSVTATPQGEYLFTGWSDGNTDATRTITVDATKTLTANFEKRKYALTLNFVGEGEVSEEIVNAGRTTEYDSGSTVKLTAEPAGEWVFVGWTGDVESTENPIQVAIGEPKEITATFEKKKYPLTVNIEGEGEVLEEIVNAGRTTDYDSGTTVKLTAVPADGWEFVGWTGAVESTELEVQLLVSEAKEIKSLFYPLRINFDKQKFNGINATTAYSKSEFYPFADYLFVEGRHNADFTTFVATINLNDNDIEDNIVVQGSHLDENKGELLFVVDGVLVKTIESPQNFTRKIIVGDYDNDGFDDVTLIGTGIDVQPYSGDSTHIVFLNGINSEIIELDPIKGYFHGGTSGDINNDGLIDILPIRNNYKGDSYIYVNKGNREFQKVLLGPWDNFINYFHSELFDINQDGYLDLFLGGHEEENELWNYTDNFPKVVFGSADGFDFSNPQRFSKVQNMGVITDFDFIDVDNDGDFEVLISRTGDGSGDNWPGGNFYSNNTFQIIDMSNPTQNLQIINAPSALRQWTTNTLIQDVNGDGNFDFIPFFANMNNFNWSRPEYFGEGESPSDSFFGIHYLGDGNGNFTLNYFKKE